MDWDWDDATDAWALNSILSGLQRQQQTKIAQQQHEELSKTRAAAEKQASYARKQYGLEKDKFKQQNQAIQVKQHLGNLDSLLRKLRLRYQNIEHSLAVFFELCVLQTRLLYIKGRSGELIEINDITALNSIEEQVNLFISERMSIAGISQNPLTVLNYCINEISSVNELINGDLKQIEENSKLVD